jgi:ABC-type transporter Mla subunit MlaD
LSSSQSEYFASNDSEEKLDSMTEALNEAYQQQNDRINQLQMLNQLMGIYNVPVHMMNIHCVIINKIHRTILKELN